MPSAGVTGDAGAASPGSLSRLLLHWGMALATLTFTGWWTSKTIFDPGRTQRVAHVVLANRDFRDFLAKRIEPVVASAAPIALTGGVGPGSPAPAPALTAAQLDQRLADTLGRLDVRAALERFVTTAHRHLIGEATGPVTLDPLTVRTLAAAAVPRLTLADLAKIPAVTIPVPSKAPLSGARKVLVGRIWLFALGAVALLGSAVALSRNRRTQVRTLGRWLIGISLSHLVVLWLFPVVILPRVSASPWARLFGPVARALGAGIVTGLVVVFAAGVVCLLVELRSPPATEDGPIAGAARR